MNEGGEKVQITRSLLSLQGLKASLFNDFVFLRVLSGLSNIVLLLILMLFILLQAIRRLMLMSMVTVLILPPMMMRDPHHFKQSLEYQEEHYCTDKHKRDDGAISLVVFEGIRKDMDDCITNDGSTAKRIEHIDQCHEELRSDEVLDTDEEDGCDKAHA